MAVILGRLIMAKDEEPEREKGPFARFYLDEIDDYMDRILDVANRLDKRLANDLRALGIEPDPENFDHELVNKETGELAHCRNQLEEVYDMLTIIKDIAIAKTRKAERALN